MRSFFRFTIKSQDFREKSVKLSVLSDFQRKFRKRPSHEIAHRLKLDVYYINRKMKNFIRRIFVLIVMSPNFAQFCQKTGFKSVLECCVSISRHLRTSLNEKYVLTIFEIDFCSFGCASSTESCNLPNQNSLIHI